MKKIAIFICCFVLLLSSGCSVQKISAPSHTAIIIMNRNAADVLQEALTGFCQNINTKSNGALSFSIQYSENATKDYMDGLGAFLFEDSRNIEKYDQNLRYINDPFLYRNYNHFTMSVHSGRVVELLSPSLAQKLNALPLAALYRGNNHLLSTHPLVSETDLLRLVESPIPPVVLLTGSAPLTDEYFKAAGFEPSIVSDVSTRRRRLLQEEFLLSEFTTAELSNLSWSDSKLYHTPSFHTVNLQLLLVSQPFYNTLTPQQQRLVQEEISYLYPIAEDYYQLRENMVLGKLKEQGITMSGAPINLWNQVDRSTSIIRGYDDFDEISSLIYEKIQEIAKTITE